MIIQLNPQIPVIVSNKENEKGYAIGWIDYSQEHNLLWIVSMDKSKEVWIVSNKEIRMQENWSLGR